MPIPSRTSSRPRLTWILLSCCVSFDYVREGTLLTDEVALEKPTVEVDEEALAKSMKEYEDAA
jgi:hypothetical protein